jgi:hypothetical protein
MRVLANVKSISSGNISLEIPGFTIPLGLSDGDQVYVNLLTIAGASVEFLAIPTPDPTPEVVEDVPVVEVQTEKPKSRNK